MYVYTVYVKFCCDLINIIVISECVLPTVVQLRSILQYSVVVFDNTVLMNYMF